MNNPKDLWTMPFGSMANAYGNVNQGKGKDIAEFISDLKQIQGIAQSMVGDKTVCPYKKCPVCKGMINHIPAGISKKSGNAYDEFWACNDKNCKWSWDKASEEQSKASEAEGTLLAAHIQEEYVRKANLIN